MSPQQASVEAEKFVLLPEGDAHDTRVLEDVGDANPIMSPLGRGPSMLQPQVSSPCLTLYTCLLLV